MAHGARSARPRPGAWGPQGAREWSGWCGWDKSQGIVHSRAQGQSFRGRGEGDVFFSSQSLLASLTLPWDIWRMGPGGRGALRAQASAGLWEGLS